MPRADASRPEGRLWAHSTPGRQGQGWRPSRRRAIGDGRRARAQVINGRVRYAPLHLRELGRSGAEDGTIVWIKPTLIGNEPADVRQYGLQNPVFPQQTTADQWFDEQQIESYRRLGAISGNALFEWDDVIRDLDAFLADPALRERAKRAS